MLIELMARLAHPPLVPLHPHDDHFGIKHELRTLSLLHICTIAQLIPPCISVEHILASVDLARLFDDLRRELLVVNV